MKETKRPRCSKCGETEPSEFYGSQKYVCKTCHNRDCWNRQQDKKRRYIQERLGEIRCERCGYDGYIGALAFHHRDPTVKENSINDVRGQKYERLKEELDKCDILCHNCHSEVHAEMRGEL